MNENEIILRLILGNVGDEKALKNICEAHNIVADELTSEEKEFFYHTNNFYYSLEEFCAIHYEEGSELFYDLLKSGIIVATKDGYVWCNCV